MDREKPKTSTAYRKRRKPRRDQGTGVTYARQLQEVPYEYLFLLGDERPRGTFDLEFWAEGNDPTCDPGSGGLANVSSMAAVGGVSVCTLVNSVFPSMEHCLHRVGPIVITTVNTIAAACETYVEAQRGKQREAGRRNADNLMRWITPTNPSSGAVF